MNHYSIKQVFLRNLRLLQIGFRPKRGNSIATIGIADDIINGLEKGACISSISFIMSKTFYTMKHDILENKLAYGKCLTNLSI